MDVVAEAVNAAWEAREAVRGLRMTYEPKYLRFFQARFEPITEPARVPILPEIDEHRFRQPLP